MKTAAFSFQQNKGRSNRAQLLRPASVHNLLLYLGFVLMADCSNLRFTGQELTMSGFSVQLQS
jgi:hypothetical protein